MTPFEKYNYWVMLSDYDIETVEVLIDGKRWIYVASICEQAVERLLKGMYVYHTGKEVPKSKNIAFIFNKVIRHENFISRIDQDEFAKQRLEFEDILVDIMFYHISDYPFSYIKVMDRFISKETALIIYQKTLKLLSWLKSFQTEE